MLGFVNIIKPVGVSSGFVVNKIKHITKQKVGHLGTLDPLATGVLPIAIGRATKFFDYFLNKEKRYFALANFGVETDTLDSEGKITRLKKNHVSLEDVKLAASKMIGKISQMPPLFSAKSVDGVRAYDAAIKNIEIDLKPKDVEVYSIDVSSWHQKNIFALDIHCSSGTYVRALIRDIAKELNTIATTVAIIRTMSGVFKIDNAITIEDFEKNKFQDLIPINKAIKKQEIKINEQMAKDLFSGKECNFTAKDGEYLLFFNGFEFSIADCKNNKIKNKIYLYEKDLL